MQQTPSHITRHIFLTGKKQVGKSTLIKKVLKHTDGRIGGFFTIRTDAFLPETYSVHLFRAGDAFVPKADNLLFICGKADETVSQRFDRLGCTALSACEGCSLILMDELGPHEAGAAAFHQAVLKQLDGDIPILGVLQSPAGDFWPDITAHPNVVVLEITEENRGAEETLKEVLSVIITEK